MTTVETKSQSKINASNEEIVGVKDLITGSSNQVYGSYNEVVGDYNVVTGRNTTANGNSNILKDKTGGKLFITGTNNEVEVYKSTDITVDGNHNSLEFYGTTSSHSEVHGFIAGTDEQNIVVGDVKHLAFNYQGQNTLMSFDINNQHSDVLFTNSHVTSNDVFVLNDSLE